MTKPVDEDEIQEFERDVNALVGYLTTLRETRRPIDIHHARFLIGTIRSHRIGNVNVGENLGRIDDAIVALKAAAPRKDPSLPYGSLDRGVMGLQIAADRAVGEARVRWPSAARPVPQ